MSASFSTEDPMNTSDPPPNRVMRIPRAADARLYLHNLEADSPFGVMLNEVLPDEASRLAYLNHLAWQVRS